MCTSYSYEEHYSKIFDESIFFQFKWIASILSTKGKKTVADFLLRALGIFDWENEVMKKPRLLPVFWDNHEKILIDYLGTPEVFYVFANALLEERIGKKLKQEDRNAKAEKLFIRSY